MEMFEPTFEYRGHFTEKVAHHLSAAAAAAAAVATSQVLHGVARYNQKLIKRPDSKASFEGKR